MSCIHGYDNLPCKVHHCNACEHNTLEDEMPEEYWEFHSEMWLYQDCHVTDFLVTKHLEAVAEQRRQR